MFYLKSYEIILPNRKIRKHNRLNEEINIGCLANTSFRKNIHNQVMAASMLENAKVHVFKNPELDYIDKGQLIKHE